MNDKLEMLDYILVPIGLVLLIGYHAWLLHRVVNQPKKTALGFNSIYRRLWVEAMMEDPGKNGVVAVQTLRNSIMASTLLATTAIMLISLIAMIMTNTVRGMSQVQPLQGNISGDSSSDLGLSIKLFFLLVCFLLAFMMNVQSIRYYNHASILINVPIQWNSSSLSPEYVAGVVNRGSHFWSLGLRAFYFSLPLFFWIFGPIPMIICSALLVFLLYFLDVLFDMGSTNGDEYHSISMGRINEHM